MSNHTMVRIPKPAKDKLQQMALQQKRSMSNMLEVLIDGAAAPKGKRNG